MASSSQARRSLPALPVALPGNAVGTGLIAAIVAAIVLASVDRQMLALLKPLIDREFGWSDAGYGDVVAASQLVAALCLPMMGWLVDRVSPRRCLGWGVASWSLFTAAQAATGSVASMLAVRIGLAGAEAIGTPVALKMLGMVRPLRRRAVAIALFAMAPSVGAMIGALAVPLLARAVGWRGAAVAVAALGIVWLGCWRLVSRRHVVVAPMAVEPAFDDGLLRDPAVWLLVAAKALTDQVWWVFLYWLPVIFAARGGGLVVSAGGVAGIYVWAALGSLAGVIPATYGQRADGRRSPPSIVACCAFVAIVLPFGASSSVPVAILACALAIFGHQIVSVLIFSTIGADRYHQRTGTIAGIAAFAGHLVAAVSIALVGRALAAGWGTVPIFVGLAILYVAGGCCLLAAHWLTHLLPPAVERRQPFR